MQKKQKKISQTFHVETMDNAHLKEIYGENRGGILERS